MIVARELRSSLSAEIAAGAHRESSLQNPRFTATNTRHGAKCSKSSCP